MKHRGTTTNGALAYITAAVLGASGGGIGTTFLKSSITPEQLKEHVERLADKVERSAERLSDKIDKLEDKLKDLERDIHNKS